MKYRILFMTVLAAAMPAVVGLLAMTGVGCSGGSNSSSTSTNFASSFTVPEEISAIPTNSSAQASASVKSLQPNSLRSAVKALSKAAADAGTDYSNAVTQRYIDENALEQFDILETMFNAIQQTNYAAEVCNGPFVAKVAWEEKESQGGVEIDRKKIEEWVAQSDWTDTDGNVTCSSGSHDWLRLRAWILEQDEGGATLVRAQFVIRTPAERNDDGSYNHYGEWRVDVKFGESDNDFFVASSQLVKNGGETNNLIMIHDRFEEGFPGPAVPHGLVVDISAIMYRALETGYGKVRYPDWEALFGPEADPMSLTAMPMAEAVYSYDTDHLAVQVGDGAVEYKKRDAYIEITHRYGVFHGETGEDIEKSKSFGFPVRFAAEDGGMRHAYYGAWQGRHQLWSHGGQDESVPQGTTVTRDDIPPDAPQETYTVGKTFGGTLSQRSYVAASLSDIQDIPVEIWIDDFFQLIYADCDSDGDNDWCECQDFDWGMNQCIAGRLVTEPFDLTRLLVGEGDTRKFVHVDGYDQSAQTNKRFVYMNSQGFFEATEEQGPFGPITVSTGVALNTSIVRNLNVSIGGNIYVQYKGAATGWVEKELESFDTFTWTPTFSEDGDKPFELPEFRELYINMEGVNYIVTRSGDDYDVQYELQSVANPVNVSTLIPDGTVFSNRWDQSDSGSTYTFVTDSDNSNFLMLVYRTVGDNDVNGQGSASVEVGAIVEESIWGLVATINGEERFFNWEYSSYEGGWGTVTYLLNTDGTYKLLDDPIQFESITATDGAGETKTLSLRFDGWLHGIPDLHYELEKNDWVVSDEIKKKIINLAAGTQLTDVTTGTVFLLKPLEIGLFLESTSDPGDLDLTAAQALDLSSVPDFVEHGMGDRPSCERAKYSEGHCVADLVNSVCEVDSGCVE